MPTLTHARRSDSHLVCTDFSVGERHNEKFWCDLARPSRVALWHASTQLSCVPYPPSYNQAMSLTGGWIDGQPQPATNKELFHVPTV
jgi:hypothetical protein